jgi:hypothetical protein
MFIAECASRIHQKPICGAFVASGSRSPEIAEKSNGLETTITSFNLTKI